jgi:hypothetical protein
MFPSQENTEFSTRLQGRFLDGQGKSPVHRAHELAQARLTNVIEGILQQLKRDDKCTANSGGR